MIKITFEVNEDFIRENTSAEFMFSKVKEAKGEQAIKALCNMIGFRQLEQQIDMGKTEFVVTPDKLDAMSQKLYSNNIGDICLLAAFSETDKAE